MSINILPPRAAAKLRHLKTQAADLKALANAATLRAGDMRAGLAFTSPPPPPPHGGERQPGAMSVEATELQAEVDRLQAHAGVQRAKETNAQQLVAQLEFFLTTIPADARLIDVPPVKLELADSDTYQIAIGRVRQEISNLSAELRAVTASSASKDELREGARKYIDGLLAKKPRVKATREKVEVDFSSEASHTTKSNIAAALAWLDPDKFLQNIVDEIDAAPQPKNVMAADVRAKRIAEIRADLLKAESIEEFLVAEAEQDDVFLARRPMADARAVLSVAIVRSARTAAA